MKQTHRGLCRPAELVKSLWIMTIFSEYHRNRISLETTKDGNAAAKVLQHDAVGLELLELVLVVQGSPAIVRANNRLTVFDLSGLAGALVFSDPYPMNAGNSQVDDSVHNEVETDEAISDMHGPRGLPHTVAWIGGGKRVGLVSAQSSRSKNTALVATQNGLASVGVGGFGFPKVYKPHSISFQVPS